MNAAPSFADLDDDFADSGVRVTGEQFASLPAPWLPCGFLTLEFPFGDHRTFRIRLEHRGQNKGKRSISLLIGPQNTDDYEQIGTVTAEGFDFRKSHRNTKTAEHAAILWDLARGEQLEGYALLVEKRCRLCMRPLTDPESIRTELGPTCRKRAGVKSGS